jgi:hypothetical protein
VAQVDSPLVVLVVCREVLQTERVIDAVPRPPNACYDVGAWSEPLGYGGPHLHHLAEALVPGNQEVRPGGRFAVLRVVNLLIGAVHPDAEHLDQHSLPVGDVVHVGHRNVFEVH